MLPHAFDAAWQQTRDILFTALGLNLAALNAAPPGSSAALSFSRNIDQILADIQTHALTGMADEGPAADHASRLADNAQEAVNHAYCIQNTVSTEANLTELTCRMAHLVQRFASI
ncbi:hypothetical protein ACMU_17695 [Actibacterium mucosum KCTC 23349]|uniref:Uncharacterized protein n=1 Tax=Actibacterium mucosum KCTC 23349 TaxID=1454373 RepID=A0A037ZI99_9RHOB|nr:hypothetical protein [Actibacterium mucosum]KAJ54540.1 hypothetical protein ACMU_17695 [Actibacterium mucosum KCTC 23349]